MTDTELLSVKEIREKLGVSQEKLAEMIGVSLRTIQNYEGGSEIPKSKYAILRKLTQTEEPQQKYTRKHSTRYYDVDASAGPIEMFDPGNGTTYKELVIPGFGDCDIALNVWGDSMEPILKSGEIVLCKEWPESFIEYGAIYLVVTRNNHRMIKYLKKSANEGTVSCVSENDFFEPFEIKLKDIFKLYTIKGHIARNSI